MNGNYTDLSRYTYTGFSATAGAHGMEFTTQNTLSIGWLEASFDFPVGEVPEAFKEKLLTFCFFENGFNATFGFQECDLPGCPINPGKFSAKIPGQIVQGEHTAYFGSYEIRALGKSVVYAAPSMIYHYVVAHRYRPPGEFIEAVVNGPQPGTDAFWERYKKLERVIRR